MSNSCLKINKSLKINLKGSPDGVITKAEYPKNVAVSPGDFHGIIPKMEIKEGESIKKGEVLFHSKLNSKIKITSPVSGKIEKIVRGEKRKIERIIISIDDSIKPKKFPVIEELSEERIKDRLLESGLWTLIKQRPYDIIANPSEEPRDIFISTYDTNPLAPIYEVIIKNKKLDLFQKGIDILNKLNKGEIYLGVDSKNPSSKFREINNVNVYNVSGNHPAGNVGVHINKISPINKGETVWTINPQDVCHIGELFTKNEVVLEKIVALSGEGIKNPRYINTITGAKLSDILDADNGIKDEGNYRIINGNPLIGETSNLNDGYLGYYNNQITVIPEGTEPRFFGWIVPIFNKISFFKALSFSWLMPNKEYNMNTDSNGGERSFVTTGDYEKVLPMDIYPMQLMKSCIAEDIEEMETLGIYEVAPEDFALTEFICPSKIGHQEIIRKGLDLMVKELEQ